MPEMDPNQQTLNAAAAAEAEDTNGLHQQQTPQQRSQEAAEEGNNNGLHQLQITQQTLNEAAEDGNINGLYGCINDHPHILDGIDKIPLFDTPLHIAASAGHAHFALEMMRIMPSFSRKLNPQGLSPLDLALRKREVLRRNLEDFPLLNMEEELSNLKKLTRTIRQLINFEKELIRVKGRESVTPLHYVAEKGDIELLAEFLCACPESILDRTIRDETALHIALKSSKPKAFEVLLGCLQRIQKCHVLGWKDDEGNTLLHIAVSTSQTQIVKSLLNIVTVNKNVKNLEGQTALDIATTVVNLSEANREIKEALDHAGASKSTSLPKDYSFAEFFMSPQSRIEAFTRLQFYQERKLTMEMRNAILVVAVLIATTAFQAVLSPPSGVVRGIRDNRSFFGIFYSLNTVCFLASLGLIMFILPSTLFSWFLHIPLCYLILSYGVSFGRISPASFLAATFSSVSFAFGLLVFLLKLGYVGLFNSSHRSQRHQMLFYLLERS